MLTGFLLLECTKNIQRYIYSHKLYKITNEKTFNLMIAGKNVWMQSRAHCVIYFSIFQFLKQQLLLCATQSLFTCDTQLPESQENCSSPTSVQVKVSCNPDPPVVFQINTKYFPSTGNQHTSNWLQIESTRLYIFARMATAGLGRFTICTEK